MSTGHIADARFRLGRWLVQPGLNTVSHNGTTVQLEPKVMAVLVCLAERAPEPVSKEELLKTVWPDTFVGEGVLTRSIFELRRVFEDEAKEPRVIQTIAKRGYRLVAPVTPLKGNGLSEIDFLSHEVRKGPVRTKKLRYGGIALGTLALIAIALFASNAGSLRTRWFSVNTPQIRSLAVLPLQNLSGDPGQEYFADGMTEELITELSRLGGLRVISRTSIMRYKKTDKSLPEIARELNVDGIVEGSVLRSGHQVRITAQLIHAKSDANVWADTYDRDAHDVLALQAAVASAIAAAIKPNLGRAPALAKPPQPVNLKAHDAYLRGFHEDYIAGTLSNRRGMQEESERHHQLALKYYRLAVQEDPGFAQAYFALAETASNIEDNEAGAKKALAIDESLSDAHVLVGSIRLVRDRNWKDAERELLRAIELSPSSTAAHKAYAYFLDAAGRLDEGMREWERAQELDPAKDHLAGALYSRRQYDRLIELELESLARDPDPGRSPYDSAVTHKTLMVCYARTGRKQEAIEEMRKALIAYNYDNLAEDLRRGYAQGGYQGALREWLKGVEKEKPEFPFPSIVAYVRTQLGDRDAVFNWLPKMDPLWDEVVGQDANVFPNLVTLRIEPMWDPLHSDPRFDELVRKVGFPH
jgi:TolB-like protein/DNA-binding winged helix-turn-helix (wHTH) protein/Tfp pilus assembly protein PilF